MKKIYASKTLSERAISFLKKTDDGMDKSNKNSVQMNEALNNFQNKQNLETAGYKFEIQSDKWRVTHEYFSAFSYSELEDRNLMLKEAIDACCRHYWARTNNVSHFTLDNNIICMDIATGLIGYVENIVDPYTDFISLPFTMKTPSWIFKDKDIFEGDSILLHRSIFNLVSLKDWQGSLPDVTWSTISSSIKKDNIIKYSENFVLK